MVKNVGPQDRGIRIVAAVALIALIYFGTLTGVLAVLGGIVAAALLITGVLGSCMLYKMLGVDTTVQDQPYSTTDDRAGL